MLVKLLPAKIVEKSDREEQLADESVMESIYIIRKLRAALHYGNESVELETNDDDTQVYSKEFMIWFSKDEFVKV